MGLMTLFNPERAQLERTFNTIFNRTQSPARSLCDSTTTPARRWQPYARFRLDGSLLDRLNFALWTPRPGHWQEQSKFLE